MTAVSGRCRGQYIGRASGSARSTRTAGRPTHPSFCGKLERCWTSDLSFLMTSKPPNDLAASRLAGQALHRPRPKCHPGDPSGVRSRTASWWPRRPTYTTSSGGMERPSGLRTLPGSPCFPSTAGEVSPVPSCDTYSVPLETEGLLCRIFTARAPRSTDRSATKSRELSAPWTSPRWPSIDPDRTRRPLYELGNQPT